jgi:carbon monoxide dehydrogenase subunit G
MAEIKRSISINVPVEKVFAYIDDPVNFPEVWPSMVEVKDVEELPAGGRKFNFVYKMAGVRLEGTSETIEYVANQRIVTKSTGAVESKFVWEFLPEGEGTKLNVSIEYTVPVPVLGKLAEGLIVKMNEREADTLVANLKDRIEA